MKRYIDLGKRILDHGELHADRTGVGTLSVFDAHLAFDLRERFPLVTVKETRWKTAFLEMLWFLRGSTNIDWLNARGSKLWDAWTDAETGDLGRIYGAQWRHWPMPNREDGELVGIDQIKNLIHELRNNPRSRRHIVSAWNVGELNQMALPPCHWGHQCYVSNDEHLDLKLFLRSSDFALGLPFNIAQYALLTHLYARAADLKPRHLIVDIGDAHIYTNHVAAMREVLARPPVEIPIPQLRIETVNTDIDGYDAADFQVVGYEPRAHVPLAVAV